MCVAASAPGCLVVTRVLIASAIALTLACESTPGSLANAIPTAPTAVSHDAQASDGAAGPAAGHRTGSSSASLVPGRFLSAPQPFPTRSDGYRFRLDLEEIYRTELGRGATTHYFDVEGDAVWTQEYMRYRVYGCGHLDAMQRAFAQIDGGGPAPVCGEVSGSRVVFPSDEETLDFRRRLDVRYRDDLRRAPSPTFVDDVGAVVWPREYLRYRVFACDDATARAAVRTLIRGGAAPPFCYTTEPPRDVVGHWSGTIAMSPPRRFTMDITWLGGTLYAGDYYDIAFGKVRLIWDGGDRMEFVVNFGDGQAAFDGRFDAPDRVRGSMKYDKIGRPFDFEMTRQ
jgi:hypothetical protein